jgi:hypothetical protein
MFIQPRSGDSVAILNPVAIAIASNPTSSQ